MPGPLFHVGATAICPHAGQITTISTNARVLVNGMPVATMGDTFLVSGGARAGQRPAGDFANQRWPLPERGADTARAADRRGHTTARDRDLAKK
jgi:hypothetical protein